MDEDMARKTRREWLSTTDAFMVALPVLNFLLFLRKWDHVPGWVTAWQLSAIFMPLAFPASMKGFLTNFFFKSCNGMARCVHGFKVVECKLDGALDWEKTQGNLDAMSDFIADFSSDWSLYFFGAEFFVVIAGILMSISLVGQAQDATNSNRDPGLYAIQLTILAVWSIAAYYILVQLWTRASCVTSAAALVNATTVDRLARYVMNLGEASLPNRDPVLEAEKARALTAHVKELNTGFSMHGLTISTSLGLRLTYFAVTVVVTVVIPFLVENSNRFSAFMHG